VSGRVEGKVAFVTGAARGQGRRVEALDRRIVSAQADVRDYGSLANAVAGFEPVPLPVDAGCLIK
jgi:hypothetical protein